MEIQSKKERKNKLEMNKACVPIFDVLAVLEGHDHACVACGNRGE